MTEPDSNTPDEQVSMSRGELQAEVTRLRDENEHLRTDIALLKESAVEDAEALVDLTRRVVVLEHGGDVTAAARYLDPEGAKIADDKHKVVRD